MYADAGVAVAANTPVAMSAAKAVADKAFLTEIIEQLHLSKCERNVSDIAGFRTAALTFCNAGGLASPSA